MHAHPITAAASMQVHRAASCRTAARPTVAAMSKLSGACASTSLPGLTLACVTADSRVTCCTSCERTEDARTDAIVYPDKGDSVLINCCEDVPGNRTVHSDFLNNNRNHGPPKHCCRACSQIWWYERCCTKQCRRANREFVARLMGCVSVQLEQLAPARTVLASACLIHACQPGRTSSHLGLPSQPARAT